MPINDVINAAQPNRRRPLRSRINREQWEAYTADLQAVIDAEQAGKVIPAVADLVRHMETEHGITVSASTIKGALRILREGGKLC